MLLAKKAKFDEEARLSRLLFNDTDEVTTHEDVELKKEKKIVENQAAWHDDDDDATAVGTALDSQRRKLPDGGINARTGNYSKLLKAKYENLVGTPDWARLDEFTEDNSDDEVLRTVGHIAHANTSSFQKGLLQYKRLKLLNAATGNEGAIISAVKFHPRSSVALIAGTSGIASLVTVDGRKNEKLHSVAFKKYPIRCAHFSPDGNEAYIGSSMDFFYVYDLMKASCNRVPLPNGITKMAKFEVSKCGKYIAIQGRFGEIHLLCTRTKELIRTLKRENQTRGFCFSPDSSKLFAHGEDGLVTVWDLSSRKVIHKWTDDGCVCGSALAIDPHGNRLATGSAEGVVNIYDLKTVMLNKSPKPERTVSNLTTRISDLVFNFSSEMLAYASKDKKDSIRILYAPTSKVFSNFPGLLANLGHCSTIDFSPHGGYLGFGTNKKLAYLYRLNHYKNY